MAYDTLTKEINKLAQKKAPLPKLASTMQDRDTPHCTTTDVHVMHQLKMVVHVLAQYLLSVLHFTSKLLQKCPMREKMMKK
jgi:hypothetical protein